MHKRLALVTGGVFCTLLHITTISFACNWVACNYDVPAIMWRAANTVTADGLENAYEKAKSKGNKQ